MRHAIFVVPGRLDARTGGSLYNHRMVRALRAQGWRIDVRELADDFPAPSAASLVHAGEVLRGTPSRTITVVDGLAFGAMPDVVIAERDRLVLVPIVHMPLADEAGIDEQVRHVRRERERRALTSATAVVATGRSTVEAVADCGVDADRIALVMPGTDRANLARGSGGPDPHLLCVAALMPGKGHEVLLRALAANRDYPWRLTCVGSSIRCPALAESVQTLAVTLGLGDRVSFAGEAGDVALNEYFDRADVFVLATIAETFGMAVAEALARGIPVVSTTTGEIPALVGADAGVLAPPGDISAFSSALTRVLADAAFRSKLHSGAIAVRSRLPGWDAAASTMASVLERAAHLVADDHSRGGEGW